MDDLISRQAAIDYFVTNVGFHDEDGYPIEDECELREIWTGYFDGIPSAQPEIIHCGECTKMEVDSVFHDCWCSETGKKVWVSHYCGYADRREEKR